MSGPPPPPRRRKPNPVIATTSNDNNNTIKSPKKQLISPLKVLSKDSSNEKLQAQLQVDTLDDINSDININNEIEIPASTIAYNEFIASVNETVEPDQIPETVIGPGVDVRGNMQFERLLRVEGKFQGTIISQGDLVIGRNGCVVANVANLRTVTVNGGKIIGDINVEKIILRKGSTVDGNIVCKIFISEKYVAVNGTCNIHTLAPEIIDSNGDIIIPVPEIEIGQPAHVNEKKKGKKKKTPQDIETIENPVNIEEQKNKLKADKLLRKEQMKHEEQVESHENGPNITDNPVLIETDSKPVLTETDSNPKTVSKRQSINNVPNFNIPVEPVNKEVAVNKEVSPRLQQKRTTLAIEPISNDMLSSLISSSTNQSAALVAETPIETNETSDTQKEGEAEEIVDAGEEVSLENQSVTLVAENPIEANEISDLQKEADKIVVPELTPAEKEVTDDISAVEKKIESAE